jgi:NADPH-dependent 2,4-dienoyl-CoA reductase/sulfur reductase-like enzyme
LLDWSYSEVPTFPIVIVGAGEVVILSDESCLPYQRPPLSKQCLQLAGAAGTPIKSDEWFAAQGIDLLYGVVGLYLSPDDRLLRFLHDGSAQTVRYHKLILTTGTRARRFDAETPFRYLRTLEDSRKIRKDLECAQSVAIIGGGVIGLEVAAAARELGKAVEVYEVGPRLMARAFPEPISQLIADLHEAQGVRLHLGLENLAVNQRHVSVGGIPIEADLFVAGIGATPNVEIGEMAGCSIDDGIVVDGQGQTNVADIYAAGDVARLWHPAVKEHIRIETWQHAQRHGAHVGRAVLARQPDYAVLPWFWTDQFGVNFQTVGFPGLADATFSIGSSAVERATFVHMQGDRLIAATTVNNGRDIRPLSELISRRWSGELESVLSAKVPLKTLVQEFSKI